MRTTTGISTAGPRRPSRGGRGAVLASSVLAAVLLAGCAGEAADTAAATGSPSSTSAASSAPVTSEPAEPTDGGTGGEGTTDDGTTGGGTGGEDTTDEGTTAGSTGGVVSGDEDPSTETPSGGGTGSEVPDGGTEGLPGWPVESAPVHGGRFWAVYVAVGAPGDPALQQTLAEVQQLWPGAGLGELGCDEGAAEALGRDRAEHAVAVYFPTEQHVTEFRRRWEAPFVGAAQVTTYCAD